METFEFQTNTKTARQSAPLLVGRTRFGPATLKKRKGEKKIDSNIYHIKKEKENRRLALRSLSLPLLSGGPDRNNPCIPYKCVARSAFMFERIRPKLTNNLNLVVKHF